MNLKTNMVMNAIVLFIVCMLNVNVIAGECDYCVCKSEDTVNSCIKCCKNNVLSSSVIELRISDDGKSIVDQDNNEVAKFSSDVNVRQSDTGAQKLPGCMCCKTECIVYDQNGDCKKEYSSCTWDFDCSCRK